MSPLSFNFLGRYIKKGWLESIIIGDTRTGKSETAEKLIRHFKLGEMAAGENVSYAGLIGGIQTVSGRFMISWGKVPLNDKRLLVIDEVSSMEIETIAKLSGVRSSGIAEITKIQSEKTFARTRLIWISNPRSNIPIANYDLGITTVRDLIGKPEDVARFDICLILATAEVDKNVINKEKHKRVKHQFTSDIFKILILWVWSRKHHQIQFENGVEKFILDSVMNLVDKYKSDIHLIESADFRLKLSRISISIAAITFSTDETFENIVVKKEHVEYACKFIDKIYSKEACGYDIYAKRRSKETTLRNVDEVKERIVSFGKDFTECLSDATFIRISDLEDFGDLERSEAQQLISFLVKNRAIKRKSQFYVKTPAFIQTLKRILDDPEVNFIEPKNRENEV